MDNYKVTITETLKLSINVMAENQEEAEQTARDNWRNGAYILDADHFMGAVFEAVRMDRQQTDSRETRINGKDNGYGRS